MNARVSSSDGAWVNTASAYLPASAMPSSDEPAWKITGCPCGERWMLSGPSTWKKRPLWSRRRNFSGAKNVPLSRSRTNASSSHESHRPCTTSRYSSAIW
ncbi:hypothetical protein D3C73_1531960 [compost metagenome]